MAKAEATNLMKKQAAQLFPGAEAEQSAFLDSLITPSLVKRPAIIWTRPEDRETSHFPVLDRALCPKWLPEEIQFLATEAEPGKSPLFKKGAFYPVDVSSIYTASAMLAVGGARRVLDVCAAPGGKSLFASVVLKPEFLLANEVIRKRLGILCHNLRKTARPNCYTQDLDPAELMRVGPSTFDLVIVDAPCSGQSLLAKGIENPGCFHPNILKGNAKRQLGILSRAAACVSPGGSLFYSTCTFAHRENESVIEKFLKSHEEFSSMEAPHLADCRSDLSDCFSYRIYPHRHAGAGGFVCLLRRAGDPGELPPLPEIFLKYPTL